MPAAGATRTRNFQCVDNPGGPLLEFLLAEGKVGVEWNALIDG
jgi:hypothetical protein